MEEMIDILDEATGNLIGEIISKDEAHKNRKMTWCHSHNNYK